MELQTRQDDLQGLVAVQLTFTFAEGDGCTRRTWSIQPGSVSVDHLLKDILLWRQNLILNNKLMQAVGRVK